jgi:hypothetical protein
MRRERDVLGPKWQIRFRDVNGWYRIEVRCFRCEHVREFAPEALKQLRIRQLQRKQARDARRLREEIEHERVADLEDRMRCSKCGNGVNNNLSVFKLPRNT